MARLVTMTGSQLKEFIDKRVDFLIENMYKNKGKRALNEKWYPEDDDDIADYSFGMIAKLTTRDCHELDEETIAALQEVSDESCDNSYSYVDVLVRNAVANCDEDGTCTVTIECAVSAPNMPMDEIEEETEDLLWNWFESKTGERTMGFEWESEDVVFDRRTNK